MSSSWLKAQFFFVSICHVPFLSHFSRVREKRNFGNIPVSLSPQLFTQGHLGKLKDSADAQLGCLFSCQGKTEAAGKKCFRDVTEKSSRPRLLFVDVEGRQRLLSAQRRAMIIFQPWLSPRAEL